MELGIAWTMKEPFVVSFMAQASLLRCDAFGLGMQSSKDIAPELGHSYANTRPTHSWQYITILPY